MEQGATEVWGAAKQLGPLAVVILFFAGLIVRQLWQEVKDLRRENREIYEARVADSIAAAQLTREAIAVMTQVTETNRAVVDHFRARKGP